MARPRPSPVTLTPPQAPTGPRLTPPQAPTGPRVLFTLVCSSARDIQHSSAMGRAESEFVVPPGCCWRVESKSDVGHGLTIVQLTELPHKSKFTFKPPGALFPVPCSSRS